MSDNGGTISRRIYIHDLDNPPATRHGLDVELTLVNQKYLALSDFDRNVKRPSFTLKIFNPKDIGLRDFQDHTVELFVNNVVLACNIVLQNAAFSRHLTDASRTSIEYPAIVPPQNKITQTEHGTIIEVNEVLRLTAHVEITGGFSEQLDENKVIQVLSKINKLRNGTVTPSISLVDLDKALTAYANATMESFERLGIFKHLYSSLELAVNCDGKSREGYDLDNEVNRLTTTPTSDVEGWRRFNARTKHINKNLQDETFYKDGINRLGEKINPLRKVCQSVILNRLQQV